MRLVKYTHACVRLEDDGRALVIDPGGFSERVAALDSADAVLITHEHYDHLDEDALRTAAGRFPDLRIWTHEGIAATLSDLGDRVTAVAPGDRFQAAGFDVQVFGGQHALIHLDIPRIANVAFLVSGAAGGVYHPGDSFTVPDAPVDVLLVPTYAPWLKLSEAVDFTREVRPSRAYSIHDGLLNDNGHAVVDRNLANLTESHGVEYRRITPGDYVDL